MIVIDVEATGIDPKKNSLLSIGAVNFHNPKEQFYKECYAFEGAEIDESAIAYCGFTMEQATDKSKLSEGEMVQAFFDWAKQFDQITLAGENVVWLDLAALSYAAERHGLKHDFAFKSQFAYQQPMPFGFRTVDLHSISYAHHLKRGVKPPMEKGLTRLSADTTLQYVGIPPEPKPHHALNGAKYEAEAFSRFIYGKNLLPEFTEYPIPEYLQQ
jgi:DNA polymerase III epsilon subunit-like protein